jgi:hypothetical protein
MAVTTDVTLDDATPDLSSAQFLLGVPLKRETAVHFTQVSEELHNGWRFDERVIVVRQNTPGLDGTSAREQINQGSAKGFDSFRRTTNIVPVFETGGGNVEVSFIGRAMRRPMPWEAVASARGEELFSLVCCQFSPKVRGFSHEPVGLVSTL